MKVGDNVSFWTYVNGTITVSPMGRTQAEKRYILDTVLEHLPLVTGSEGDMDTYNIHKFFVIRVLIVFISEVDIQPCLNFISVI